jgi:hypothetical protein
MMACFKSLDREIRAKRGPRKLGRASNNSSNSSPLLQYWLPNNYLCDTLLVSNPRYFFNYRKKHKIENKYFCVNFELFFFFYYYLLFTNSKY